MNEIERAIESCVYEKQKMEHISKKKYNNSNLSLLDKINLENVKIQALQEKQEREENDKTPCKCDKFIKVNVVYDGQVEVEYCKICKKCGKIKYHFCYGHYDYSMSGMIYKMKSEVENG